MGIAIVAASIVVIGLATLLPSAASVATSPFCLICGQYGGVDTVLNVLLFAPLGFGLALTRVRTAVAIAAACAFTLTIELLQFNVIAGRDASLGDILMNSLGAVLGFGLGRNLPAFVKPRRATAVRLAAGWLTIWIGVQVVVAYSLIPALPDPPYYGQIDRPSGRGRVAFPGSVLSAAIDLEPVRGGALSNAARLKELLASPAGASLRVAAVPGGIPRARAELVVLSGPEMVGVLSLEQHGAHLIYGLRTGAEALRLRPYELRLRHVFDEASGTGNADTLRFTGRYSRTQVSLAAQGKGSIREQLSIPRLSQGWILFMPFRTYIDGDVNEIVASAFFMMTLILPAAYWARFASSDASGSARSRDRWRAGGFAGWLAVGLMVIPTAFGLSRASLAEWSFVVAGVAIGAAVSRVVEFMVAGHERSANRDPAAAH